MSAESKAAFFRQSGWMVMATLMSGVFLVAIYPVVNARMPSEQVGVFMSLLRLFTVLAIPAAALQTVLAQQSAAAVTPERQRELAVTARSVVRGIFLIWCAILVICTIFHSGIIRALKITNPLALWITLGLALAALTLPIMQGLLQGRQNFFSLGWSVMLNGVGRFAGVLIFVMLFRTHSTGALMGALVGMGAAVAVGYWPNRDLFKAVPGTVDWRGWLGRVVPLTCGVGSLLFVTNADVLFVQSHFNERTAPFYSAVAMLGVGLVSFTAPISTVMFPKLVSSFAKAEKSNSFALALGGTALLSVLSAVACTIFPRLPLRVIHFNKPEFWASDQLVPWFMWAMVPLTLANVLTNNLLARSQFALVPWLVAGAVGYGLSLDRYLSNAAGLQHYEAFKGVVLRLGVFSSILFLIAIIFSAIDHRNSVRK